MHDARPPAPAPIRSRGQLELELARLAMRIRHACGELSTGRLRNTGVTGVETIGEWFGELADELVARTDARLTAYAKERLKALAARWRIAAPAAARTAPRRVPSRSTAAAAPHA